MSTNTYPSAIDSPEILGFSQRPAAWPPKMGTPKRQRMDTTHLPEAVLSDPDAGAPSGLNHSVADQLCGQNPKHGGNKTPRSVVIVGYFVPLPCISKTDFVGSEKLNQIRFSRHHFGLQCQYLQDIAGPLHTLSGKRKTFPSTQETTTIHHLQDPFVHVFRETKTLLSLQHTPLRSKT